MMKIGDIVYATRVAVGVYSEYKKNFNDIVELKVTKVGRKYLYVESIDGRYSGPDTRVEIGEVFKSREELAQHLEDEASRRKVGNLLSWGTHHKLNKSSIEDINNLIKALRACGIEV